MNVIEIPEFGSLRPRIRSQTETPVNKVTKE